MKKTLFFIVIFSALALSLTELTDSSSLFAQNRKPRFSQLDFDDNVYEKPRATPTPDDLNPLEELLRKAQQEKKDDTTNYKQNNSQQNRRERIRRR